MDTLLLTLGHNSSAIAIRDGKIYAGYEEERLSKIKSDSSFPIMAIEQIGLEEYEEIMISHWDPFCKLSNMKHKHWQPENLPSHKKLVTLDRDFTHHDAHMMSGQAFVGAEMPNAWTIVADGFGNFGEVLSIYNPDKKLVHRSFGYEQSLGLMYQYATNNIGMKMNEDEYKLLGYEPHIADTTALELDFLIEKIVSNFVTGLNSSTLFKEDDPLFDISALVHTQLYWDEMLEPCGRKPVSVAYVVQTALERTLRYILKAFDIHDVILVGGVFMNVKANNDILQHVTGNVSVMPLSGDQGAAIGLYKRDHPVFRMPKSIAWGWRELGSVEKPRVYNYRTTEQMSKKLLELLSGDYIVNIVHGPMEFGPRALCNTSTIALPTMENVEYINKVNGRNTIMPMGPVVAKYFAHTTFPDLHRVIKSADYMVTTLDYDFVNDSFRGAAHMYPFHEGFSGRPQLMGVTDPIMGKSIEKFHLLINTSFNIHGVPICFDNKDIEKCVDYQQKRDVDNRIYTLILCGVHDV